MHIINVPLDGSVNNINAMMGRLLNRHVAENNACKRRCDDHLLGFQKAILGCDKQESRGNLDIYQRSCTTTEDNCISRAPEDVCDVSQNQWHDWDALRNHVLATLSSFALPG